MQPAGADADEHMVLGACLQWLMEWPKSQISLGGPRRTSGATSKPPQKVIRPSIVQPSARPPHIPVVNKPATQAPVAGTRKEAPAVVATTSRHQILLGASAPQKQDKGKGAAPQLEDINEDHHDDDMNDEDVDAFLTTKAFDGSCMPALDEE